MLTSYQQPVLTGRIEPKPPGNVELEPEQAPVIQPFETNLRLSTERLKWLWERIQDRILEVMLEMGREPNGQVIAGSFMGIRQQNQDSYEYNYEWRKALGGIFLISNYTHGDNQRYVRTLSARVRDDLMGTKPFFAAMSVEDKDAELASEVEEYLQNRIATTNVGDTIREAIRIAMIRNEAVIKTTYVTDKTMRVGPAEVMVGPNGMPVMTPQKKLYVFRNDDFVPDRFVQGLLRLEKDPSFSMRPGQYRLQLISRLPQVDIQYQGAQSVILDHRDFLCPLKAAETWQADINVHLYDISPSRLKARYPNVDTADTYFKNCGGFQSGAMQPNVMQGEWDDRQSSVLKNIFCGEVYIRCDADDDGYEEEIMAVIDMNKKDETGFVFYDYTGQHMSRRPFSVITGIEKAPNAWHSIGVFSKMAHHSLYTDTQLNRINEKDSQESTLTYAHKRAFEETKAGIPLKFGDRKVYTVCPDWDPAHPPIARVHLQSDADLGTELMNSMRASADRIFAVLSGSDASASRLNESHTATGVMSVERDANVVSKDMEQDVARGIEATLALAVEFELDNMDANVLMLKDNAQRLVTLNRAEIRALPRKVKLLLTKTRSAEMLATNEKAETVALRYMRLSPYEQYHLREMYLRQLKGLEIDGADRILPEVSEKDLQAWQEAQKRKQEPPPPPSKSISTKYSELARSEQIQVLQQEGLQPASDDEINGKKSAELAQEVALKEAGRPAPSAPKKKAA